MSDYEPPMPIMKAVAASIPQNTGQKNYDPDAHLAREHVSPDVASTEQKNAFRTRREQFSTYPESVCVGRYSGDTWQLELDSDDLDPDQLVEGPVLYVRCDIAHQSQTEAEARGAAEERRKSFLQKVADASERIENRPDIQAWQESRSEFFDAQIREIVTEYADWRDAQGNANVAALEARVKELEGVLSHLLETEEVTDPSKPRILDLAYTAFMSGYCGKNPDDGGKCDWFTDTRPQIIRHIEKARAALTREGGV